MATEEPTIPDPGTDTATGTDPAAKYDRPGYEDKSFGQAVDQDQQLADDLLEATDGDVDRAEERFREESAGAPALARQAQDGDDDHDIERSTDVAAPAAALFDYLADVENLPDYFDSMTEARRTEGDAVAVTAELPDGSTQQGEAWFRSDRAERRIEWGSEGPNDYRGWLEVTGDDSSSKVTVGIHSKHTDIADGLDATLANIKRLVEDV